LAVALALGACTFGDAPTDPGGDGGPGGGPAPTDPSFANDVQPIFNTNGCATSGCHGSATRGDLDLRTGTAYGELVSVSAVSEPGTLVIPGDADNSYLVIRLEDRQSAGSAMPLGRPALTAVEIQTVRNWIAQGAQDN
jgi:hypothetical protein